MRGAHAYFKASAYVRLHYRCWTVPDPRAAVIVAHGLGEHSGRYEELARDLARAGLSTFSLDHRGHGRSDGQKGYVSRFVRYVQDLERFRRRVVGSQGRDVPVVMLGHSMGGLIVLRHLQEFAGAGARAAVLSAPLLRVGMDVPRWKEVLGQALRYLAPALPLRTGLDPDLLSHDREVVEAYRRDPLVHDYITPRLYTEIQREAAIASGKLPRIRTPVLFLLAGDDRLTATGETSRFADALAARRAGVEVKLYRGLFHEVLNESTRSHVVADLLGWIERRIAGRSAAPGAGARP